MLFNVLPNVNKLYFIVKCYQKPFILITKPANDLMLLNAYES